jgi:hypothetical protein
MKFYIKYLLSDEESNNSIVSEIMEFSSKEELLNFLFCTEKVLVELSVIRELFTIDTSVEEAVKAIEEFQYA